MGKDYYECARGLKTPLRRFSGHWRVGLGTDGILAETGKGRTDSDNPNY